MPRRLAPAVIHRLHRLRRKRTDPTSPGRPAGATCESRRNLRARHIRASAIGRWMLCPLALPRHLRLGIGCLLSCGGAAAAAAAGSARMTSLAYSLGATTEGGVEFRAIHNPSTGTGDLQALGFSGEGISLLWRAAAPLAGMAPSERVIVTYANGAGAPFKHDQLDDEQRVVLSASEVDWLRGAGNNRRLGPIIGARPLFVGPPRALGRGHAPYPMAAGDRYAEFARDFRNRRALVYVGANDGMLHAFAANGGDELFAYVPNKLIDGGQGFANRLDLRFAEPGKLHYLVDLTPTVEDVFIRPRADAKRKAWRTLLVGGLGRGGKGYFALDVSDPDSAFRDAQQAAQSVLWEFTDQDDAYPVMADGQPLGGPGGQRILDANGQPVKDLGYALSQARVGMSNAEDADGEKKWVAILGNGPDSTAASATLFILFLDLGLDGWQEGDFVKLSTAPPHVPNGLANGLGEPALVDLDLNGTVDRAYAGDLLGNLHRFDLSGETPSDWSATAIFQARSARDPEVPLPIVARPQVLKHPDKPGFIVVFGTGGEAAADGKANTEVQSLFGIWDAHDGAGPSAVPKVEARSLVRQRMTNIRASAGGAHRRQRIVSNQAVRYRLAGNGGGGVRGWRLDFNAPRAGAAFGPAQHTGERAHPRLAIWDDLLFVTTILSGAANGGTPGAVLPLSLLTGGSPGRPILDLNEDGELNEADLLRVDGQDYAPGILFEPQDQAGPLTAPHLLPTPNGPPLLVLAAGGQRRTLDVGPPIRQRQGRLSWRELTEFD